METMRRLMDQGVGLVCLHYAVEFPKGEVGDQLLDWLGGYYETGYSINPHWKAVFKSMPEHPITRGVKPFGIQDEWYFNIRFAPESKKVTPILKSVPPDNVRGTPAAKEHPGRSEIVAWAFERDNGGRSFGFTGGHFHNNWGNEDFRKIVLNAILWSAKVDVPRNGVECGVTDNDLKLNLDKGKK
jgi:type 1 glutamine amidotransferase